tara:strand:- start:417 stop:710 length:294 start_codon:yes stop_codon:yes gene_type:complete
MDFDYDKSFRILEEAKLTLIQSESLFKKEERELKYKYLCSFYSKAYLSGSLWYIGKSIKEYILNKDIRLVLDKDYKLIFLYHILDNNLFPSHRNTIN